MRSVLLVIALAGAASAHAQDAAVPPPPAAAEAVPAPPAAACEDFYAHANAGWLADAAAPASPFAALAALGLQRQRALLDALPADARTQPERQLAAFWHAANDEAAIEAAGLGALQDWFERIHGLRDSGDVADLLARAHAAGLPLLFRFQAGADLREPARRIAYALQGGLGLPDRDYYLREDPSTQALLTHYRAYVARLLTLSGTPAAQVPADVAAILDIETRLARASLSLVQLRDPNNSWRPTDIREIAERFEHLEWKDFLRAQKLRGLRTVSLAHTSFFVEADHLVGGLPPAQWRAYLRFHLLDTLAPHLPRAYREARFALFGAQLRGLPQPPPRWQQALEATDRALGEWLGAAYAARYLDPATAARAAAIAQGVASALARRIAAADWLGAAAREGAAAKLAGLDIAIGHADPAPTGELQALSRQQHAANVLAVAKWRQRSAFAQLDQPAAPAPVRGHQVNAFYDLRSNRLAAGAALLAPPLLGETPDPARDYGALGALLAHELWHAVDAQGATIDAEGRVQSWWTAEDFRRFAERTRVLADQYGTFPALGEVKVDGRRTFLENLADLAGLSLAWDAWHAATGDQPGVEARKRFFEAYAGLWRQRMDLAQRRLQLATSLHAPPRWRVLGPLSNFTPFAETYGCTAGTSFVLPAEQRLRLWD